MWLSAALFCVCLIYFINAETAVLILARGGSKGIPLKNLEKVGEYTLLARSIKTALQAGITDVTISTDHPLIALEAIRNGARVFHRSRVTASDWAPSIWGAAEFLAHRLDVTILILMQVTSPLLRPTTIRNGVSKINYPRAYDCVFSTVRSFKLRWHERNNSLHPVNFDVNARPRRQDWGGELVETGAFYITRRHLIEKGHFQNNNCTTEELKAWESLEVDCYYDLLVANALHNYNKLFTN